MMTLFNRDEQNENDADDTVIAEIDPFGNLVQNLLPRRRAVSHPKPPRSGMLTADLSDGVPQYVVRETTRPYTFPPQTVRVEMFA